MLARLMLYKYRNSLYHLNSNSSNASAQPLSKRWLNATSYKVKADDTPYGMHGNSRCWCISKTTSFMIMIRARPLHSYDFCRVEQMVLGHTGA
jgi:hypothetical protein